MIDSDNAYIFIDFQGDVHIPTMLGGKYGKAKRKKTMI